MHYGCPPACLVYQLFTRDKMGFGAEESSSHLRAVSANTCMRMGECHFAHLAVAADTENGDGMYRRGLRTSFTDKQCMLIVNND